MTALPLVQIGTKSEAATRTTGDRLELLTALMDAPAVELFLREDVLVVPGDHSTYGWVCRLADCECPQEADHDHCTVHMKQWRALQRAGESITDFLRVAEPLKPRGWLDPPACLVCPGIPAWTSDGLCYLHSQRWTSALGYHRRSTGDPSAELDFDAWLTRQGPFGSFGICRVRPCPELADTPLGLCRRHTSRYEREGRPGGAQPAFKLWRWRRADEFPMRIPIVYADQAAFDRWCRETPLANRTYGKVSLLGLRPLLRAEIQWAMFHHATRHSEGMRWPLPWIQYLVDDCRSQDANSLVDLDVGRCRQHSGQIAGLMLRYLRPVYFSRQDTKDAGFIETEHFGVQFRHRRGHFDLTGVSQRWLRDLLWEYIAARLTTDPPRSPGFVERHRRGCLELSAYLEAQAPHGGHDTAVLTGTHMLDFVADQRHRAQHGLPTLAVPADGHTRRKGPRSATKNQVAVNFNSIRQLLRDEMDTGETDRIGLHRSFAVAVPLGGMSKGRRSPFPDDVARALASEENVQNLQALDIDDRGLRDVWEALVLIGRRCSEVLEVRLECIGRLKGITMFWHAQTKVGNIDEGIRIPERLYQRIEERQEKTIARFVQRYGRPPTPQERREIALFPRRPANRNFHKSISSPWFGRAFRQWVNTLDIAHCVAHQARHTLATNLLKAGANLTHVKRYLGQVSERMAEHYVHIANTDPRLNDALNAVWVSGPGSAEPGLLLASGEPMTREEAEALAIDLSRRSTPAEGGFCTFQPVVNGNACLWNMDCHNCDKFVLSGADLVYWHRKREQWRTFAERAPDPATADYLHDVFEPTARATEGLETALDAVGLLEEALALDLLRPQDYFGRVWSTAFRAQELTNRDAGDEAA
ncbi:site-specific integrase [Streptomyces aureocirculatus]|uniref:site-specific integrase n=1 Tax=Streptomyces aureocirculatus TaxID=67275 RepID=UPI000B303DBF|nr:site-specific integrase [Streptomyces aureocirculatus]